MLNRNRPVTALGLQAIEKKIEALPPEMQQAVIDFVEFLQDKHEKNQQSEADSSHARQQAKEKFYNHQQALLNRPKQSSEQDYSDEEIANDIKQLVEQDRRERGVETSLA